MKNTILFGILFLYLFSSGYSQKIKYSDYGLNNKIKSFYQTCYTVKVKNKKILKNELISTYNTDYAIWRRPVKYSFNKKGYLISIEDLFKNENSIKMYFYNSNNELKETITYSKSNNGEYNDIVGRCKIQISDTIIKQVYYLYCNTQVKDSALFFEYYKNGLMIKKTGDFPDGNKIILYYYDKHNNQIKEEYIYLDGTKCIWNTKYKYNKEGVITDKIAEEGEGFYKNIYTYFSNNLLKSKMYYGVLYTYKYRFDKKGNWISKIEYTNNIPKYIYERIIEY